MKINIYNIFATIQINFIDIYIKFKAYFKAKDYFTEIMNIYD